MQDERIVVGLDIGTTKVCAVVGRMNEFGKLEVLGIGKSVSEGVKEGTVNNINKTIAAIESAIKQAEDNAKIDIGVVNVGIAGKHIKIASHHGSITRKSGDDEITLDDVNRLTGDMYRIVTEPGSEIIHVIPQHYMVDYEGNIKDPVGMSGVKIEADFHLITANANAIKNINKCVERVGLEIENMILEPIASSLAVLSHEEKEAGVCIVDIGGGTTDVAIFHDGILRHTAVIPFGGNIITQDIKQGCAIMQNQAELLKVKFGSSIPKEVPENEYVSIPGLKDRPPKEVSVKNVAFIIEARMEEIIDMVLFEIKRSGYSKRLSAGVVITGGGAQLRRIQELFKAKSEMDVRIGYPNEYLGKTKDELVKNPSFATAVGLVLAGFKPLDDRYDQKSAASAQKYQAKTGQSTKGDLFSSFIKSSKKLLLDDFDDKGY
ncbi:MAG: cell division protein FtsA [Flammeovirgaceae bacterium]